MTTIVVVRKGRSVAIAADTMTKWGAAKETAAYVANNGKLLQVGDTWLGLTGNATFKTILRDYFGKPKVRARFDSPLESTRFDALVANPHGIFGVVAHRTVQEFTRYYAFGSGSTYAMGALHALYDDPKLDAEALARRAVETAAELDDATGLPLQSQRIRIKSARA